MKAMFEQYGDTIIQVIGGLGILTIAIDLLSNGGSLHQLLVALLNSSC